VVFVILDGFAKIFERIIIVAERTTPGMNAALTIGGSDSSGGAGIQADMKTWTAMRVYGCCAVTAIAVQNTRKVGRVQAVDAGLVGEQIEMVASDIDCRAAKTGLMPNAEVVRVVAKAIKGGNLQPLVVDPSLIAKSGDRLADDETMSAMAKRLFPLAAVVVPSRFEVARLLGGKGCETMGQGVSAAKELSRKYGCHAVIVKGFERPGETVDSPAEMVDIFWNGEEVIELVGECRLTKNLTGAGCVFSAGITGGLVLGMDLVEAVLQAKRMVTEAIRQATDLGSGYGPVNHGAWIDVKK